MAYDTGKVLSDSLLSALVSMEGLRQRHGESNKIALSRGSPQDRAEDQNRQQRFALERMEQGARLEQQRDKPALDLRRDELSAAIQHRGDDMERKQREHAAKLDRLAGLDRMAMESGRDKNIQSLLTRMSTLQQTMNSPYISEEERVRTKQVLDAIAQQIQSIQPDFFTANGGQVPETGTGANDVQSKIKAALEAYVGSRGVNPAQPGS